MIACKAKQWGNSIGIIIPRNMAKDEGIHPGEEVIVEIKKKSNILKHLFGSVSFKKSTAHLIKESRKGFESKYV